MEEPHLQRGSVRKQTAFQTGSVLVPHIPETSSQCATSTFLLYPAPASCSTFIFPVVIQGYAYFTRYTRCPDRISAEHKYKQTNKCDLNK